MHYSDFDVSMAYSSTTHDTTLLTDDAAVVQSVMNLVQTAFFERPFQPSIGSRMGRLLFEPLDNIVLDAIAYTVKEVIDEFEPRAKVVEVHVTPSQLSAITSSGADDNGVMVDVVFSIVNLPNLSTASIFLRRLR